MTDPASPPARRLPAPRWRDGRLLGGVLLVLLSVVAGTRAVAAADRTELVWRAAHDLAPGSALGPDDVSAVRVRLQDAADRYLAAAGSAPAGWTVTRQVAAGELLPRGALGQGGATRVLALPVPAGHEPPGLARGDRVDVYATPRTREADAPAGAPRLLLGQAPVEDVTHGDRVLGAGGGEGTVVVRVPAELAPTVVAALQADALDLVRVP